MLRNKSLNHLDVYFKHCDSLWVWESPGKGGGSGRRPLTGIETLIGFRCRNRPLQMRQKNKTVIDKDVKCDPHVSFRSCSISRARISVPERSDPCEFVLFCLS